MSDAITRAIDAEFEFALSRFDMASYRLGWWDGARGNEEERNRRAKAFNEHRDALFAIIALIDPERIARLEMVALAARNIVEQGPSAAALKWLATALDARDALDAARKPTEDADANGHDH